MRRLSSYSIMFRCSVIIVFCAISQLGLAQSSPHGSIKQPCTDCHTTASWKDLAVPMKFNHATTGFSLQGAHANVQCLQCHTTKRFAGTPSDCFSCHKKDFAKAMVPNHQVGLISHDCITCHTNNSWRPSIFEHSKTNFQLVGSHASVECSSCHANNRYKGLPGDCFFCHQKDYSTSKTPNHAAAQFSHDCLTCHTMNGWQPSSFDHKKTNFALVGIHASVECSSCHKNGQFKGVAQDCYSCHQKDYNATVAPKHAAAQFDRNCTNCHSTNGWTPSFFDHAKTDFKLTGAHVTTECSKCHTGGLFKGTSKECYPCHQKDLSKIIKPDHIKGQYSQDCLTCHTNTIWKPSTFDHNKTLYPLLGAHVNTDCAKCHVNEQYKNLPNDCYTCHQAEFTKVTAPNHQTGRLSHDCLTCHTNTLWKPSTFDHNKTNFLLKGAHISVDCASCHSNGQFKGVPSDCFSCHQADFNKITNPNHLTGQFSHECLTCHSNTAWKPSSFNHNATAFPLVGAHASVVCASCHTNGQYKGLTTDCFGCHQNNFNSTTTPNHVTSQFSHDCLTCHTNMAWKPSTFKHSNTNFPLLGAHAAVACFDCHKNGQYKGTTTVCFTCHQSDFNGTTDPNHLSNNFDHNCLTCHSMNGWTPATFNHSNTSFPLSGAHNTVLCAKCHVGGKFAGTSKECYVCHKTVYDAVVDPNHLTGKYSVTCLQCHNTTVWRPWIFGHDSYFRISSHHQNRARCADCHRTPGTMTVFSCTTGCHSNAHKKNQLCYPCHKS